MIVIVCLDSDNGMLFNNRRQSQDREVRKDILKMTADKKLYMNDYSYGQFVEDAVNADNIVVAQDFFEEAGEGEYCFVENEIIPEDKLEKIIVYRWDKKYPADFMLNISLARWKIKGATEFEGYSHSKIIKEEYSK